MNVFRFGDNHYAGGILIESVDNSRSQAVTDLGNGSAMMHQTINQGPMMIPAARDGQQARVAWK